MTVLVTFRTFHVDLIGSRYQKFCDALFGRVIY